MRRLITVTAFMLVLLFGGAIAASADAGLLGSGEVAPGGDEAPAAPVETVDVVSSGGEVGADTLAATGLDSGATALLGLGMVAAGGAAVVAARRRTSAVGQ